MLFFVCAGIVVYGAQNIPLGDFGKQLISPKIYLQRNSSKFLQDWTREDILSKINTAREKEGFSRVTINDKLNKAALNRMSVILSENDYDGTLTGVTREASIKSAGYDANLIGDVVLMDFFKTNDPILEWESDSVTRGTLMHPDFKNVGIAIKNDQDTVSVYVIFVSPQKVIPAPVVKKITWGGPDLWSSVNKRRVELGVNPLNKKDELCTIASIRLNQLLELKKLDGHAGFVPTLDREDLKWISQKYNISEFLAQGYDTPTDTVAAWENTLGHKALLSGGEYVWGCVYAQNTFAVAIAAY